MGCSRYMWLASTYRPPELGSAEIDILYLFTEGKSQSAYDILKKKRIEMQHSRSRPNYKDVHKRVKRLAELKLIYQVEEQFERGAKHYRLTPYGLITSLDKVIRDMIPYPYKHYSHPADRSTTHIPYNKDNIIVRSLLSEFFEDETIDSFHLLKEFPGRNLEEYLHDCCSITTDICRNLWTWIERYNIMDILPSDDIIQKYMSYISGRPVEQHVLDEIKEYEKRLAKRLDNGESKDSDLATAVVTYNEAFNANYYDEVLHVSILAWPPFPLLDMYLSIVWRLIRILEEKRGFFVFSLVTELGKRVQSLDQHPYFDSESELQKDFSLECILKDKRFIELVSALKKDFDSGYKQFSEKKYLS